MSKFKTTEYIGVVILSIPIFAVMFYFISNKDIIMPIKTQNSKNIDTIALPSIVVSPKMEIEKIPPIPPKIEPSTSKDTILKYKEIKEKIKIDTSKMYIDGCD